jgi:hypothetical protein
MRAFYPTLAPSREMHPKKKKHEKNKARRGADGPHSSLMMGE